MSDSFPSGGNTPDTVTNPARGASAVTPSNSVLSVLPKAIWVGGAGNLRVKMANGNNVTFAGIQAGTLLPIRPSIIYGTDATVSPQVSTTATLIVAIY